MTAPRNLILVALAAVAAMALLALFLGVGREGRMRDAEADFQARLRAGQIGVETRGPVPKASSPPRSATVETASNDAEMAEWYAGGSDENAARPAN